MTFIFLIFGAFFFSGSLLTLIHNVIMRKPIQEIFKTFFLSLVFFLLAAVFSPPRTSFGPIVEHDVFNGTGTEKVGKYATVELKVSELTTELLNEFYDTYVEDQPYNWVTLLITHDTGLHFSSGIKEFDYAELAEDGSILKKLGVGLIFDDYVDYTSFEGVDEVKSQLKEALADYSIRILNIIPQETGVFLGDIEIETTALKSELSRDQIESQLLELRLIISDIVPDFQIMLSDPNWELIVVYNSDGSLYFY